MRAALQTLLAILLTLSAAIGATPVRTFAQAQTPPGAPEVGAPTSPDAPEVGSSPEGDRYEVFLWTIDQGDQVWEKFGHNAIVIRDYATGQELAWNWGLFDFDDADFLPRFLRGSMLYSMGPTDPASLLRAYVSSDRTVFANRVLLTQDEAARLDAMVRLNFLPENRDYIYHYFRDNCSTRVRDALDVVLGGLIRETFVDRATSRSYRWHTRRLVQETLWIDQGLSFLLGTRGDLPRTEWDAMFVPMELMGFLEGVERPDPAGGTQPILGQQEVLYQGSRAPAPAGPPGLSLLWLLLGVGIGGAFVGLGRQAGRARGWARWSLGLGAMIWGLFCGILGGILVMAWFTDHDFIHRNLNLFYISPGGTLLALAAAYALIAPRGKAEAVPFVVATAIAGLAVLVALLEATPVLGQGNGEVLALALPVNISLAWAFAEAISPRSPVSPHSPG